MGLFKAANPVEGDGGNLPYHTPPRPDRLMLANKHAGYLAYFVALNNPIIGCVADMTGDGLVGGGIVDTEGDGGWFWLPLTLTYPVVIHALQG